MAGKGIFFTLGTLFGGLGAATVLLTWPTVHTPPSDTGAPSTRPKRDRCNHLASQPYARGRIRSDPSRGPQSLLAAGAALLLNQNADPFASLEQRPVELSELDDPTDWTPQQIQEFEEQEQALHHARQAQIRDMRQDLVRRAKLDLDERNEFLDLVQEVTKKLTDGERELDALMGPLLDPGSEASVEDETLPDPPRLALLQNDFERSKALLNAQTRFEALLGPERLEALGPEFQSVEAFIEDEPLSAPQDAPIKGEHAPGTIR